MLLVLFGYPGSGKSFIGKILENEYGFYHYEADRDLTPPIKEAILRNQPIPDQFRQDYFDVVFEQIKTLKGIHQRMVVTQTFTKNLEREWIHQHFPEAMFIWVKANPQIIKRRLAQRNDHLVNKTYANLATKKFDHPNIPYRVLENNCGEEQIRLQLINIFQSATPQYPTVIHS